MQGPTLQMTYSAVCCGKAPISMESESPAIWIMLCGSWEISPTPILLVCCCGGGGHGTEKLLQDPGPIKSFLTSWAPFA